MDLPHRKKRTMQHAPRRHMRCAVTDCSSKNTGCNADAADMLTHLGSTARRCDAVHARSPSTGTPRKAATFIHMSGSSKSCASSAGGLGLASIPADGRSASAAAAAASTATMSPPAACSSSFLMCADGSCDFCCPEVDAACAGATLAVSWSRDSAVLIRSTMMAESVRSIVGLRSSPGSRGANVFDEKIGICTVYLLEVN